MKLIYLVLFVFISSTAFAEDQVVCAAVLPCNSSGEVLPVFKEGPCGAIYESQCKDLSVDLCKINSSNLIDELKKSSKMIDRLRKKIRAQKKQLLKK